MVSLGGFKVRQKSIFKGYIVDKGVELRIEFFIAVARTTLRLVENLVSLGRFGVREKFIAKGYIVDKGKIFE